MADDEGTRESRSIAEALRLAEERYRGVVEQSTDAIYIFDAESKELLESNAAFRRMLGWSDVEPPPRLTLYDFIGHDPGSIDENVSRVLEKGSVRVGNRRYRRRDGTEVDVDVSATALRYGGRWAIAVVARDVSENLAREERMRLLAHTVESSTEIITVTDLDDRITFVNRAFLEAYGYTESEILGEHVTILDSPRNPAHLREAIFTDTRAGGFHGELLNRRKDGSEFPISLSTSFVRDDDGRLLGLVGMARDISERRAADQLRNALYRIAEKASVVEDLDEFYAFLHGVVGELLYARNFYVAIHDQATGLLQFPYFTDEVDTPPPPKPLGRGVTEFVLRVGEPLLCPKELFDVWVKKGEVDLVGAPSVDWLGVPLQSAGRTYGVLAVQSYDESVRFGERDKEILSFVARQIATAVERKRAEDERRRLEEQLRQAQKMEAIGRLAGGIAHDFNNLLTTVLGYSDLLLKELAPDDPFAPEVGEIRKAAERAAGLTRQLLAFSRKQILAPQVLDLNGAVLNMEKMLRRLIGEDVLLEVGLDEPTVWVRADAGQIEQLVVNLAVNARDAMPDGGTLRIETGRRPRADAPRPWATLAITDTGIGMDAATRSRIFEPFFTTKEKGKGTGLGLATVYGVVTQAGGEVEVETAPGKGSRFTILLPEAETPAPEERPRRPSSGLLVTVPDAPARRVLLVEDEDTVRELARRMLEETGFAVTAAKDGDEALRRVAEQAKPFDILVTDLVMPGMSGQALAARLRAQSPTTRVLFISGYTEDTVVRKTIAESGVAFLQKPFTRDALARKVTAALDGAA